MQEHYFSKSPTAEQNELEFDYHFADKDFKFRTDSSVFSRTRIDFGSALLIESAVIDDGSKMLDLAAGYGAIGIILAAGLQEGQLFFSDINERAVKLTKDNIVLNSELIARAVEITVLQSDGFAEISERDFDYILLNPPIRAGKQVIFKLYRETQIALKKGGELWIVIQKKQGAPSTIKELETIYSKVEIINKDKGYFIIKSTK
jgi:16S rRNA (guanine1207-N2)-methyltransferase